MSESIARISIRKARFPITDTAALLLVTLVQWFAVANPVLADQPNKQARQKVSEGLEQYSSGNYEQAAKSFAEAAQTAPDNPIIKFDEACAVSAAGDDDKARELLLQASVSSDPQVSAAACYNLAAIAAKRGRKELGDDPMAATPEVRQATLDKLKIAVTHYRDCLRIAPEHQDARHNLELVLTLTNYLQQQWQNRDHQQTLEKMSLFELLKHLDDQQLSIRSTTLPYKGQSAAKVSRFDRSKMANQQLKLLDDIPTLKSKIDAQLSNSPGDSSNGTNVQGNAAQSGQSELEAQLRKIVNEQLDQANQAIQQASEDVRSANWDRALERQRFTNECLRKLQTLFSTFPENLDLAIELQESLIETNEDGTPSSTKSSPAKALKKDRSTDGQAWQQDWVSNFSQSLAAKASATLQSLPADVTGSLPEEPPVKDLPEGGNQNDSNEASQTETSQTQTDASQPEVVQSEVVEPEVRQEKASLTQSEVKTPELSQGEVSELPPEQQQLKQQEEFTKQLRKALERTTELAPAILERSNEAKRLIVDSKSSDARLAQDDVLQMLKEIRDLLPKQSNQQQDKSQDKKQEKDQNQDQNQDKDQKESDQEKQNEQKNDQQDSKNEDQKQKPENGQNKKQDKSKNSDKSDQNDDGDQSSPEKKPDTEKPQPKDQSEEPAKKSSAEQAKEQAKEQAAGESEKANPDSKSAEQTAQQIAEQRAQAVLRRIREREAKYRELLQQLRERQAHQTPVEKDW